MAELADAHGSGPCGSNTMRVQVSFPASYERKHCDYSVSVFLCHRNVRPTDSVSLQPSHSAL